MACTVELWDHKTELLKAKTINGVKKTFYVNSWSKTQIWELRQLITENSDCLSIKVKQLCIWMSRWSCRLNFFNHHKYNLRVIPQKVSVLIERVKINCLLQIFWAISTIDVASVERRHRSFTEICLFLAIGILILNVKKFSIYLQVAYLLSNWEFHFANCM